jgi:diguanylate cyclase (GGDEF)-like protein
VADPGQWPVLQLAEFVAVLTSSGDEEAALQAAVERAAEAVDAEVGALLSADLEVVVAVGLGQSGQHDEALRAVAAGQPTLEVPGEGVCDVLTVPLDAAPGGVLVLARSETPFTGEEQALLRGMGRVLTLVVRLLRLYESEAKSRADASRLLREAVRQATHDQLTGLPNRALVLERLEIALAGPSARRPVTVTLVGVDRFKLVNDVLGHEEANRLLIEVGARVAACARPGDTVGRLTGDMFVVVSTDVTATQATAAAERMISAVAAPVPSGGADTRVTASAGIARSNPGAAAEQLLGDAEVALSGAKERGRARVQHFDRVQRERVQGRMRTEQALRTALPAGELAVWFQPTVWSPTGEVVSMEAVLRWHHPELGLVQPAAFIDVAEDTGLIVGIGAWVLEQACADAARWQAVPELAGISVAVNLSARQLADPGLVEAVTSALRQSGLPADHLWLELTESALMDDADGAARTLDALRATGVRLAIDDFGTGYSSLSYLRRFPVDALKIDQSFVSGLGSSGEDEAIVRAIIRMAEELGLTAVAEGVETAAHAAALAQLGCYLCQGFLYARPIPVDEATTAAIALSRAGWHGGRPPIPSETSG